MASPAFVALAALCWGLSGGIAGILMDDGWDPFVVSFYRGAIGLSFVLKIERPTAPKWAAIGLVMLGIALLTRVHDIGTGHVTPIAAVAGLLSGLSYYAFTYIKSPKTPSFSTAC